MNEQRTIDVLDRAGARRVLAVASCGGHWRQLLRLADAWSDCDSAYVSVGPDRGVDVGSSRYHAISDASRSSPWSVLVVFCQLLRVFLRERPDVVVSTGAAPGVLALWLGRLFGARTVWIDSAANADRMSMSGRLAGWCAHLWLTQWPHLAHESGPRYAGSVL